MTNDTPDDTTDFNENPTIKTLKNQAIIDITKTALSNINNERHILYKLIREDKRKVDIANYYEQQVLNAENGFKNYYAELDNKDKIKKTLTTHLQKTLKKMDTDLTQISDFKDLDDAVYDMLKIITSHETIAKTMLDKINIDDNYNIFEKNIKERTHKKFLAPHQDPFTCIEPTKCIKNYIDTLIDIRNLAITRYNEINVAYTEITNSTETGNYKNQKNIEDCLRRNF